MQNFSNKFYGVDSSVVISIYFVGTERFADRNIVFVKQSDTCLKITWRIVDKRHEFIWLEGQNS